MIAELPPLDFNSNVFINCPFDKNYTPLLRPLLFTIVSIGLRPRISLETFDSSDVRLHKIKKLIESSKYSIHDLSRSRAKKEGEYFRHNMPFELGLDYGLRSYHPQELFAEKKLLILEEERYSVQKSLSDLSFADCKCHKGEAEEMVFVIRSWFAENGFKNIKSPSIIWDNYNFFMADLYAEKEKEGFRKRDIERLPVPEFLSFIYESSDNRLKNL